MLSTYRSVLSRPGAIGFSAAGLVGRLPLSMAGLGIVLLVQGDTGSYGVGGSVSAVYMVANAVVALPPGRLVDARGQGRVLTLGRARLRQRDGPPRGHGAGRPGRWRRRTPPRPWPAARLPPVDACVRDPVGLRARPAGPDEVETAYAFEAVIDEAVFMVGPILVTLLATLVDPVAGIAAALVAGVGGQPRLRGPERHRAAPPPPRRRRGAAGAAAVAPAGPAHGGLRRAGPDVRCRRGHHRRLRVRARRQVGLRRTAGAVGARQPARRGRDRCDPVAGAAWPRRVLWGSLGLVAAMAPLALVHSVG